MAADARNNFDLFVKAFDEGGKAAGMALLSKGLKPNDALRDRASMLGMMPEHFHVFQFLIENGGDPNMPDKLGETPLTQAALLDQRDFLKLFISLGANVEKENRREETPLMRAAASGHAEICEVLIACGADVNRAKAKGLWKGSTPLMEAALRGHVYICGLLLASGAEIDHQNENGETALMKAAFEGRLDICLALIEARARVDMTDRKGRDALRHAVKGMLSETHHAPEPMPRAEYEKVIQLLIEKGADLNAVDREEESIASVISRSGDQNAASFLMRLKFRNKVKPQPVPTTQAADREEQSGVTPLVAAIAGGDLHEIETLLKQGADINKPTSKFGATPLIWAVIGGQKQIIEFLLRHGADIYSQTSEGKTAIDYAVQKNDTVLVDMILKHQG